MKFDVDGKQILEELAKGVKEDRQRVSLYLSKAVYNDLRKSCGKVAPSLVVEKLIEQFLASLRKK